MVYRPLHFVGRFGLAACAVSLGVASLSAQTAPSAPVGPNPSRVDVFTGYSYYGAHGQVKPAGINYSSVNVGAIGSVAYYFNKYVGAEIVVAAHPNGQNDGIYTYSAGLIARAPMQNFTLFAHGLPGAAYVGGPNNDSPALYSHEPYNWGVSLTAGGGMDYDLPFFNHRFSLRLFEADYKWFHEDYGPPVSIPTPGVLGGRANVSGVDLSTGIITHFGHIIPPPPVTYTCAVSPTSVYPGDPVTATGTALNLDPKKIASYTWSVSGGTITGTSSTANVATAADAPGTYTVKGHVSEGAKPGQMADCSADFTVKQFEPPTISCSANPSTVSPGDSSTITARGMSPQNRPLTYSYRASSGNISGTASSATLSTSGAAPGTITVTCNVVDDKGQSASSTTSVTVLAPPPPPPPPPVVVVVAQPLCSISFDRDKKRPSRVDNEGKACLDDLALSLQRTTDSKLFIIGNATSKEKETPKGKHVKLVDLAAERAVNTKAYLVTEKGIDPSRIVVGIGTDDSKSVTDTLVQVGAVAPSITPIDENAVKAVPRTPAKKKKK
jgi:OmpA family